MDLVRSVVGAAHFCPRPAGAPSPRPLSCDVVSLGDCVLSGLFEWCGWTMVGGGGLYRPFYTWLGLSNIFKVNYKIDSIFESRSLKTQNSCGRGVFCSGQPQSLILTKYSFKQSIINTVWTASVPSYFNLQTP